jgi:hypothetical protein
MIMSVIETDKLTNAEKKELKRLEAVIDAGIQTFVEVGQALARIQQERLYRGYHWKTFEAYVEDRFELSRRRAYQLIEAAKGVETAQNLCKIFHKNSAEIVPNEYTARSIAAVPEEQLQAVLDEVVVQHQETGKPVTGRMVKDAAQKVAEKEAPKPDPKEQIRMLKSTVLKHYQAAMRAVDDMQRLRKDPVHPRIVELNVLIQDEVAKGWK